MDSNAAVELRGMGSESFRLDEFNYAAKVQRIIGNNRLDSPIALDGDIAIYRMVANPDKLRYLWRQSIKHKALFWHSGMESEERFTDAVLNPKWVFFEVYKFGYLSGLIYFTDVPDLEQVQMHAIFFDRALTDKLHVGKLLIHWMFDNYPI